MRTTNTLPFQDQTEPSLFQFGTGSVLLHVGLLAILALLHTTTVFEDPQAPIKVTLIEPPVSEPLKEEPKAEAPPLMTARRPIASRQAAMPLPLSFPAAQPLPPMTLDPVSPPVSAPNRTSPIQRSMLQDHRASDSLTLRSHLKTIQRTVSPTTSALPLSWVPKLPSLLLVPDIPSPNAFQSDVPNPPLPQSEHRTLLTATPPGTKGISRSKVGLNRTNPPVYPRIARESGWEGRVVVRAVVLANGTPETVRLQKSSGHPILDEAALEAVKHWQFVPAKDGNISIRSLVEIPINFELRQEG